MSVMTSYGLLIHESAKTARLARTQTCEVHPDRFSSTCSAERGRLSSACFAAHAAKGTKAGGGLAPPVPCHDKATIQLPCLEDSSSRGSHRAGACNPISPQIPWHGRDCQTLARDFRKQQRLTGCISLLLPLEESSNPCCSLSRLNYIPLSLRLLALSPYPKRRPNLDKTNVCSAWPQWKRSLVAPRTEPPSTSSRINFPPLSKDKTAASAAIAPHKMSTMVTHLHCKMAAGSF